MLSTKSTLLNKQTPIFIQTSRRQQRSCTTIKKGLCHQRHVSSVRATISKDDKSVGTASVVMLPGSPKLPKYGGKTGLEVKVVVTIRNKDKEKLLEKVGETWRSFMNKIGQGISIQLVSEEVDPVTKSGKRTGWVAPRGWLPRPSKEHDIENFEAQFTLPSGFGRPGAIIIKNHHSEEIYLMDIAIHDFPGGSIFFTANTWIHSEKDNPEKRILFSNHAYLPSQTPEGMKDLRQDDLISLRGNGEGERKKFERIYDYATYNDLGNPDVEELVRPELVGMGRSYPRRCRTGRPLTGPDNSKAERMVENPDSMYVPRDETFEEFKQIDFNSGRLKALLHNLIPLIKAALSRSDNQFQYFSDIDELYREQVLVKHGEGKRSIKLDLGAMMRGIMSMGAKLKYDIPLIISRDRFSWLRDNEFARQTLAGVNPVSIERLREFPIMSKLDTELYGPPESALTKEVIEHELNGMSLEEAMQNNRLFILDYHDLVLPFVKKINKLEGRRVYASRTIIFLTNAGILKPIAIELSQPLSACDPYRKRVYTYGHDATTHWIWKWAKAHVCSIDAGVHQLVNHWLRTHACMEPYIIAAHRQLSVMHPVFKLLHPHMRYTMEINALARQSLINGGGIIESCFTPGKYSMELSAAAYKSMWRFDTEALPADLVRRGMAVEDPSMPCGVKLIIEDYPYAADSLLVWEAIQEWVHKYINHFYADSNSVTSDLELQAWWDEIKNKGHEDKKDEPWWPKLNTRQDLIGILTTMIWTASGQHAAINFGQYPFGGYMPNRPTLMKKLIPQEDEPEYEDFILHPERVFLSSLPSQLQATQVMAVQDTLSTHSQDEEYLGSEARKNWTDDQLVLDMFEKFSKRLAKIEETINMRNKDSRLKNRCGAGIPPYELLLPTSDQGVTGRGIPNSISI